MINLVLMVSLITGLISDKDIKTEIPKEVGKWQVQSWTFEGKENKVKDGNYFIIKADGTAGYTQKSKITKLLLGTIDFKRGWITVKVIATGATFSWKITKYPYKTKDGEFMEVEGFANGTVQPSKLLKRVE